MAISPIQLNQAQNNTNQVIPPMPQKNHLPAFKSNIESGDQFVQKEDKSTFWTRNKDILGFTTGSLIGIIGGDIIARKHFPEMKGFKLGAIQVITATGLGFLGQILATKIGPQE